MGLSLAVLASCSSRDTYQPAAIPPLVVKVPTYVSLPADATQACAEPQIGAVETDVDAVGAGLGWKATSRCNAMKLCIIEEKGKAGAAGASSPLIVEACRQKVWKETVAP